MAAREAIYFPCWAQLATRLKFLGPGFPEPVANSPPEVKRQTPKPN